MSARRKLHERFLWWLIVQIDRHPKACWSGLVGVPVFGHKVREVWRQDSVCRYDVERNGYCYCGKLRETEVGVEVRKQVKR